MTAFAPEATVVVRPYVQRKEGPETIIGHPDRKVFLAIPNAGAEILEGLAAGETVAETARRYEAKHQQPPDIDEFLAILAAEGFLGEDDPPSAAADERHGHTHGKVRGWGISLNWISPRVAAWLTSGPALLAYFGIIALGVALFVSDPSVVPGYTALLFPGGDYALLLLITFALAIGGTLIHEFAHAVSARATGIPVSLGMGNLLYVIVAQTDITGIQLASKGRRYLAVVAGTIADLVAASLIITVIYAGEHGGLLLPHDVALLLDAVLYSYLLRMMAQLFFYVRTDFYYLVATAFDCRNLLEDTEVLLRNVWRRLVGRKHRVEDQSHIRRKERAVIRGYAVVYLIGRGFALLMLFFVIVPLLAYVVVQFAQYLAGQPAAMGFLDFLTLGSLMLLTYGGGIWMWGRSLQRGHQRRKQAKRALSG